MKEVTFPIKRTIVYNRSEQVRIIEKDTLVRCYWCGKIFPINEDTVSMAKDDMQLVCCPELGCNIRTPILYYFDRVVDPKRNALSKKKRKKHGERSYLRVTDFNRVRGKDNRDDGRNCYRERD